MAKYHFRNGGVQLVYDRDRPATGLRLAATPAQASPDCGSPGDALGRRCCSLAVGPGRMGPDGASLLAAPLPDVFAAGGPGRVRGESGRCTPVALEQQLRVLHVSVEAGTRPGSAAL